MHFYYQGSIISALIKCQLINKRCAIKNKGLEKRKFIRQHNQCKVSTSLLLTSTLYKNLPMDPNIFKGIIMKRFVRDLGSQLSLIGSNKDGPIFLIKPISSVWDFEKHRNKSRVKNCFTSRKYSVSGKNLTQIPECMTE